MKIPTKSNPNELVELAQYTISFCVTRKTLDARDKEEKEALLKALKEHIKRNKEEKTYNIVPRVAFYLRWTENG